MRIKQLTIFIIKEKNFFLWKEEKRESKKEKEETGAGRVDRKTEKEITESDEAKERSGEKRRWGRIRKKQGKGMKNRGKRKREMEIKESGRKRSLFLT